MADSPETEEPHALSPEASETNVSVQELDASIRDVMSKAEYAWRMPREKPDEEEAVEKEYPAFLTRIFDTLKGWWKTIRQWISKFGEWLEKLLPRRTPTIPRKSTDTDWMPKVQRLIFVLLAGITCMLALLLWRAWKRRQKQDLEIATEEVTPTPDITDENVDAGELPEDGWLALAKELMEKGQLRLSLRALYLATLACLAQNELLTIAKFKSDRDYERELQRRAHVLPSLLAIFTENMLVFERTWYGMHEVTQNVIEHFTANYQTIKAYVKK
jgi:hypothetical protein